MAVQPDYVIFGLVAGIIILGFGGELFFKRTGVPSFLFLIFVGILLGPVLGAIPGQQLLPILGTVATLTLIMVVFYSGMDINIRTVVSGSGRILLQVTLYVIPSIIVIGVIQHFLLGWDLLQSLIFGSIIGGETTAAVVIPLSRSLKLVDKTITFVSVESILNSIYSIVIFSALVAAYQTGTTNVSVALGTIASKFSVGIMAGGILSIVWILLLDRLKNYPYTYVFTLGLVFATYSISFALGGSGILACLIFGILLGSYKILNGFLPGSRGLDIDPLRKQLTVFQGEISFLLETFFFVFLGLTFSIKASTIPTDLGAGLVLLGLLLAVRVAATSVSTRKSEIEADRTKIILLCAQGLTPATLAILALNAGVPLAPEFLNLVTYVIILTNIVTAAASLWIARSNPRSKKSEILPLGTVPGK